MHACLRRFPGAALELGADGVVRASNGHLDALIGRDLTGVTFSEVIDSSSQAKWRRILSAEERANPACTWELAVATPTSLEVRTFLVVWGAESDEDETLLWLLEFSADPKMEALYQELTGLHRDLVEAQRNLSRERGRLARALKKARAAVRTRDEVLAIVSHDLRNPVSVISMSASILEMPIPEDQKARSLAAIKRSAATMNRLIADLLDASALESGKFSVEPAPLAIGPVLEEACEQFSADAREKRQHLDCHASGELPLVSADRERVLQVLSNLIGNAIKFTPDGGRITLTAECQDAENEVLVSVRDTGAGIEPADLPNIFESFWRTSRNRRGGAGLGLAISKGIVEAHGGRIDAESRPGHGSTFSFTLPVAPRPS
jgi:signal transduction histidine kinase